MKMSKIDANIHPPSLSEAILGLDVQQKKPEIKIAGKKIFFLLIVIINNLISDGLSGRETCGNQEK